MFHHIANEQCQSTILLKIPLTILGLILIDCHLYYIFIIKYHMVSTYLLFSIQIVLFGIGFSILAF
jgi:hypothetical protein